MTNQDLLAIADLLNVSVGDKQQQNVSDIQLLEAILGKLEQEQQKPLPDQSKGAAKAIEDSAAFPNKARNNLIENTKLWTELDKFNAILRSDYSLRRQMLIHRLDCTVESFKWKAASSARVTGNNNKNSNDKIHTKYAETRGKLEQEPSVDIAQLLAVRES